MKLEPLQTGAPKGLPALIEDTMKIPLPVWADKTCEKCIYRIDIRCRRAISSHGYAQVSNYGKFQLACSFYQEASK